MRVMHSWRLKLPLSMKLPICAKRLGQMFKTLQRAWGLMVVLDQNSFTRAPVMAGHVFPKDTLALVQIGEQFKAPQTIVETVVDVNTKRQLSMADRVIAACHGDVKGKKIAILGIAFKPNTDDIREAPSLVIIDALQKAGAKDFCNRPCCHG
jgi:UDPglucose 6-dehydrogenase